MSRCSCPTHRAGPEVQQAPIRLKNLLREATEVLQADGARAPMIHSVLAPLRRLVNDGLFWQYQSDGLALYSRPGWWRALRVPLDLFAARQPTGAGSTNGGPPANGDRALREVLELAAVTTLLKGGAVYAPPRAAVPRGGSAAVFRYSARVPRDRAIEPERS